MKLNAIVYRYILKEMIGPFLLSLSLLLFIFLMTTMLQLTDLVVNYRVDLSIVGWLILYSVPSFLGFIIPMSSMLGILVTFLKMSSDNEIIALKAAGIGLYQLLPPVFVFCIVTFLSAAFMMIFALPWGKTSTNQIVLDLKTYSYSALLRERAFNESFKGMVIYVNKIDLKSNALIDVFIEDRNNQGLVVTVTAPKGQLMDSASNDTFHLRLYDGFINQVQLKDKSSQGIRFETYDVRLDLSRARNAVGERIKDQSEMTYSELRNFIHGADKKDKRYFLILLEYYKKLSLPFACIALGILAVPLGIQSKSAKRSFGVGLGLIFFLIYYLMLSAGLVFGEAGVYPPIIGMWAPNLILGGFGIFLLIQAANERPLLPILRVIDWLRREPSDSPNPPTDSTQLR
jgi:lipopolysaccharide export system permease protein